MKIAPDVQQQVIAEAAGLNPSTVSRWKNGDGKPDASAVIAIARAFNADPVEALVVAGYLGMEDLQRYASTPKTD